MDRDKENKLGLTDVLVISKDEISGAISSASPTPKSRAVSDMAWCTPMRCRMAKC
jgi:hypothetical protein